MPEPERSFLRDLKNMDKRLGVKFNGEHMVVTYDRGYGEPVNIHRVKADDGSFRQPDRRDLEVIKAGDLAEGEKMDIRLRKLAYVSEQIRAKAQKDAADNIRNMTKYNKLQLKRFITDKYNLGKNSEFRRVPHKPGKNVVAIA